MTCRFGKYLVQKIYLEKLVKLVNNQDLRIICSSPINAPAVRCYVALHMETEHEFKR